MHLCMQNSKHEKNLNQYLLLSLKRDDFCNLCGPPFSWSCILQLLVFHGLIQVLQIQLPPSFAASTMNFWRLKQLLCYMVFV